ncbi:TcpQ domain-containing protein [Thalassotalea ganghwensis]
MLKEDTKRMLFWIRNIGFALILIVLGYYLITNQDTLFSEPAKETLTTEEKLADKAQADEELHMQREEASVTEKSKNAAAEGLSRFYANLRGTDDETGPRVKNNIVYLPEPRGDLVEMLKAKQMVTRPLRSNWRSSTKNAPFRPGFTLNQKLSEYAEESGLEVIWWLDKDFLIKDPFRINKDIVQMAYQIGKGIEGHFPNGLRSYFCYKHRSIVLTEKTYDYLDEECTYLDGNKRR